MRLRKSVFMASCVTALITAPGVAEAQSGASIGQEDFGTYCAACHGLDGKGKGPVAGVLKVQVPDLTALKKNNGGVFPYSRVYGAIDGRDDIKAHGTRNMPIWGNVYNDKAVELSGPLATSRDSAHYIRGRIIALIGYLDSIQEK